MNSTTNATTNATTALGYAALVLDRACPGNTPERIRAATNAHLSPIQLVLTAWLVVAVLSIGPLLVLLFLGWTVVAPLVSFYNTGQRIADSQRSAGLPVTCSPVVGLLLCFVFGLQTLYYQIELNRVVDAYRAPEGTRIVLPG